MKIPISFRTAYARANKQILVDSGATNNFIHPRLIRQLAPGTQKLEHPRKIWNINGTNNKVGQITDYVDLNVQTRKRQNKMRFLVTDLGHEDLILIMSFWASSQALFQSLSCNATVGIDNVTSKISALGLYPIRTSRGDCPVDSFFQELCVNSVSGR